MTLPNMNDYVVPGTYWAAAPTPVTSLAPSTSSVVALVGPGIGYRTNSESQTLTGTTANPLAKDGINTDTVVVTSPDGSTVYVNGDDYAIVQTGSGVTATTTVARESDSTIPSGSPVNVSYQYTDASYTTPTYCTSFNQVQAYFGNSIDPTTGDILSPLSYAAQFAINNGASQLYLVATPTSSPTTDDLNNGYAALSTLPSVNIVVPLPVGLTAEGNAATLATNLSSFVDASANTSDILQIGIIGFDTASTDAPDTIALGVADERVIEAWPNQMQVTSSTGPNSSVTTVVGGFYLAAAYAGVLAGNLPQQGLTRQTVKGFTGISPAVFQTMTKAYKDQLSGSGVAVTELNRQGILWCRHGTTTNTSSVFTREISLVRAQDTMVEALEASINQTGLIGTPIGPNTVANIQALTIGVLSSLKNQGIIYDYSTVTSNPATDDPTDVQVQFDYQPSYPLNFVTFVFSVNTTTGTVSAGTPTPTS
jgi:hypothetical protein